MSLAGGIAVAGAGLIGKRHLAALRIAGLPIHSVVDPDPAAAATAAAFGVVHHADLAYGLAERPAGVVLATPSALHRDGALACIAAGVPVLVEKPIATETADARLIVEEGEKAGVPVLAGHYRRHMPVIAAARQRIEAGAIGAVVAAHAMIWLAKPDAYFDTPWRRAKGAGPVLTNLIHDIDILRHLLGDIANVRAVSSNRTRGHAVEDTLVALATLSSGALVTLQVSDTIVAPWSWELTGHDNPAYPPTGENAILIGGTLGSLALPRGEEWSDGGARDWWQPISRTTLARGGDDPLVAQLLNFAAVIAGTAEPVCSGREGMKSLAALLAIARAAETGNVEEPEA